MSKVSESGPEQTEIEGVPAPKPSEVSGDSSISSSGVDEEAIFERLGPRIEQEVERRVQSIKDKRIGSLEKQVEGYGNLLGQLQGVLPDDVLAEHGERIQLAEDRKILRQLWERENQSPQQASTTTSVGNREWERTQTALQDVFARKGLLNEGESFENSRAYIEFYKANKAEWDKMDHVERLSRAYDYADAQSDSSSKVSPAAIAQAPGGGQRDANEQDQLNNYIKEMTENRGNKAAILAIQNKYREMGVPIENVGFS